MHFHLLCIKGFSDKLHEFVDVFLGNAEVFHKLLDGVIEFFFGFAEIVATTVAIIGLCKGLV